MSVSDLARAVVPVRALGGVICDVNTRAVSQHVLHLLGHVGTAGDVQSLQLRQFRNSTYPSVGEQIATCHAQVLQVQTVRRQGLDPHVGNLASADDDGIKVLALTQSNEGVVCQRVTKVKREHAEFLALRRQRLDAGVRHLAFRQINRLQVLAARQG